MTSSVGRSSQSSWQWQAPLLVSQDLPAGLTVMALAVTATLSTAWRRWIIFSSYTGIILEAAFVETLRYANNTFCWFWWDSTFRSTSQSHFPVKTTWGWSTRLQTFTFMDSQLDWSFQQLMNSLKQEKSTVGNYTSTHQQVGPKHFYHRIMNNTYRFDNSTFNAYTRNTSTNTSPWGVWMEHQPSCSQSDEIESGHCGHKEW